MGVLEDMSLASRVLEDTFSRPWPWPWESGPWPCEIFNETYLYWHRSEEGSYDSCKDRSFPSWQDVTTLVVFLSQVWCASTSSLAWCTSTGKGRHMAQTFWVYAVCPWESSPWPWSWPRGLCPWPCHLCPWLHHCLALVLLPRDSMHSAVLVIVNLSVRHTRGLCPHGTTYDHGFFTVW